MAVEISSALLRRIMRLVRVFGPAGGAHEWCGILRGDFGDGSGERIARADDAANVAPDPTRFFEIDPAALLAAYRDERRGGGLAVLGFFHTHPQGPPAPSREDAACAAPDGRLWLIAAQDGAALWRAVPDGAVHRRFDPVFFDLVFCDPQTGTRVEKACSGVQWRGDDLARTSPCEPDPRGQF